MQKPSLGSIPKLWGFFLSFSRWKEMDPSRAGSGAQSSLSQRQIRAPSLPLHRERAPFAASTAAPKAGKEEETQRKCYHQVEVNVQVKQRKGEPQTSVNPHQGPRDFFGKEGTVPFLVLLNRKWVFFPVPGRFSHIPGALCACRGCMDLGNSHAGTFVGPEGFPQSLCHMSALSWTFPRRGASRGFWQGGKRISQPGTTPGTQHSPGCCWSLQAHGGDSQSMLRGLKI